MAGVCPHEVAAPEFDGRGHLAPRPQHDVFGGRARPFLLAAISRIHEVAAPEICNPFIYPNQVEDFFVPIDSVAVFDHEVGPETLQNVECMVVCGHALSAKTFAAIRDRVSAGAVSIIARRLYEANTHETLPGKWVLVNDFRAPQVKDALAPFLGPPDAARFRFKHQIVEFRKTGAPDATTTEVRDR